MWKGEIIGNLGDAPEERFTQKGARMAMFNVAVNQRKTGVDNEKPVESTEWFRVRVSRAEWAIDNAMKLTKGQRVYVSGRFEIERFQKRDGTEGWSMVLWADEVHPFSVPRESQPTEPARTDSGPPPVAAVAAHATARPLSVAPAPRTSSQTEVDLEDLPFLLPRHIQEPWLRWYETL